MKARENRRLRRKRDKKHLRRLAAKRFGPALLKADGGKNADYYTVSVLPKMTVRNGRRYFDPYKTRCKVSPNQKHRDMVAQLAKICEGVTVDLREIFPDTGEDDEDEV